MKTITVTDDRGDALAAAVSILGAARMDASGNYEIPLGVYRMLLHASDYIGAQYTAWLRGEVA